MANVTTVSITRCWPSIRHKGLLAAWLTLVLLAWLPVTAHASTNIDLTELQVERGDDGLYLSARLQFALPAVVEDALNKGIPVHFVADAEVMRERWYWYDRQMARAYRYMRVSYQPLTRRWRLNTASEPIVNSGLGVALTQYFDTLAEVMASVQRISRWRIATAAELDHGGRQTVHFRFRLDATQLPRTFQIGVLGGESDWALSVERRVDLTPEAPR